VVNGIIAAGAIFSGTNPGYTSYELSHAVKVARVNAFIVEPELVRHVQTAAQENGIPNSKILIFDTGLPGQSVPQGLKSWRTLFNYGERDWEHFDDLETAKNTQAARLFSSGTTGLPKAAVLSHYNFIAQETMISVFFPRPYKPIQMIALPMFHVAVAPRAHFSPLRSGMKTYFMRRFDLEPFLANIERFGITELITVPPVVIAIIMSPASKKYSLKSIKQANCGAAPLGKETQLKLQVLLGDGVPFTQVLSLPTQPAAV
jgi:4-coumarate--CoA ligase